LLLATGTGARLSPASGVRNAAWLVALDVRGTEGREAVVQLASGVERDWLSPTHTERRVWVDDTGRLRAVRLRRYGALTLQELPDPLQPEDRAVLARAWHDVPRSAGDQQLLARLAFAGIDADLSDAVTTAAADVTRLDEIDLESALPWEIRQRLLTDAPTRLPLPSGRTAALTYEHDGSVRAAVKLQELFGLAETPRIGPRRDPVVFELLAPNGRPVQTTRDLRSFWTTTYAEVRKQLRARYPKHPWPEDPWTATPTHRTTPRGSVRKP
jgi:ATP-dependent helicase HrpB